MAIFYSETAELQDAMRNAGQLVLPLSSNPNAPDIGITLYAAKTGSVFSNGKNTLFQSLMHISLAVDGNICEDNSAHHTALQKKLLFRLNLGDESGN